MADTYDQFDKATKSLTAYALVFEGLGVGRIVLKYGNACTAYAQIWGASMTKGQARGGGYDRASAAICGAADKMRAGGEICDTRRVEARAEKAFVGALCEAGHDGSSWVARLEKAGFTLALVIG